MGVHGEESPTFSVVVCSKRKKWQELASLKMRVRMRKKENWKKAGDRKKKEIRSGRYDWHKTLGRCAIGAGVWACGAGEEGRNRRMAWGGGDLARSRSGPGGARACRSGGGRRSWCRDGASRSPSAGA